MLCRQIEGSSLDARGHRFRSIFIGGGTPSILDGRQISRILETVRKNYQILPEAEITIECNPGTLTREKLHLFRESGINRLSLGAQSMDDRELKLLGRIHTKRDILESFSLARKEGFSNISLDLMSALPGQSPEDWERTLREAVRLKPEHVSAYSLIIEEGTQFYRDYAHAASLRDRGEAQDLLPDEESERRMYHRTGEILEEAGYRQYEISNYARSGFESIHNSGYWERIPYLGFGLGAASLIRPLHTVSLPAGSSGTSLSHAAVLPAGSSGTGFCRAADPGDPDAAQQTRQQHSHPWPSAGAQNPVLERETGSVRYKITDSLADYLKGDFRRQEEQYLSLQEEMEETMFLGLRMTKGVQVGQFFRQFGVSPLELYRDPLNRMAQLGLLEYSEEEDFIRLTREGMDVSNAVMVEFLL